MTQATLLLLLLIALPAWAQPLVISQPVWLFPPERTSLPKGLPPSIELRRSKNNAAIGYYQGRLYVAFRTADHHQPRPPAAGDYWTRKKVDLALRYLGAPGGFGQFADPLPENPRTRLYVISTEVDRGKLREFNDLLLQSLTWRLEFEAHDKLAKFTAGMRQDPSRLSSLLGPIESQRLSEAIQSQDTPTIHGLLEETDLREPLFATVRGRLLFYFVAIEGAGLKFNPLRTYAVHRGSAENWSDAIPILKPKELLWEMKASPNADGPLYATSYTGGHYEEGDKNLTKVHFQSSEDGLQWQPVGSRDAVYSGGANEAGFEFDERGDLWSILRLDDGDAEKGWGSLLGRASARDLGTWEFPTRADPRRFDSPRMFRQGDEIYLIARQKLHGDPKVNAPYDLLFEGRSETEAEKLREDLLDRVKRGKDSNKDPSVLALLGHLVGLGRWFGSRYPIGVFYEYDFSYWAKHQKRTAVYHLDKTKKRFEWVTTLPSAGDTAFPSVVDVGKGTVLVMNYSSAFEHAEWSWGMGQRNPTGLYFINLKR